MNAKCPIPWVFSAQSSINLDADAAQLLCRIENIGLHDAMAVAQSLAARSTGQEHRAVVLGEDPVQLRDGLQTLVSAVPGVPAIRGRAGNGKTVFVFPGQGAQRTGMGSELAERFDVFGRTFDEACFYLDGELPCPLKEVMFVKERSELLEQTVFAQAALFAFEISLYRLVTSWGVRADYLVGHSLGELTAACAAEVFTLQDACRLVGCRARLMQGLPPGGAMIAVEATEDEVIPIVESHAGAVSIAAVNGPHSVVLSGDEDVVTAAAALLVESGRRTHRLRVSNGYHSARTEPMLNEFRKTIAAIDFHSPIVPLITNLTGRPIGRDALAGPEHWVRHVRQKVRFHDALRYLSANAATRFMELGPQPTLTAVVREAFPAACVTPTLLRNRPEGKALLTAVANLYVHGAETDWQKVVQDSCLRSKKSTRSVKGTARKGARSEPIAVVGMSCRFPGGASDPEGLWKLLISGTDAISALPDDRGWDLEHLYDPDPNTAGTSYVREGGFLKDLAGFDAKFFGIAPAEAMAMEPQQRLLLEASWSAIEHARIAPDSLAGTNTGVYFGVIPNQYGPPMDRAPRRHKGFLYTGNQLSVASGRVSYFLGLQGPALSIDTSCSSSLTAVHMACQALGQQECTLALAGGATAMATPGTLVEFARLRGIAANGRCKPFATSADGTGWSEGVGVVVLQRLSDAMRDGNQVLATILGSGANQDGASEGLSAPSGTAQRQVIEQALAAAGLSVEEVDAVEAHGTGTRLGDRVEAQALLSTYGQRSANRPLLLGSVKSNIGHTQAAAGVAGLIKTILAFQHQCLPATLHFDSPTPAVDWAKGNIRMVDTPTGWPVVDRPWRAGISSFGISGTNIHVIVEQAALADSLAQRKRAEAGPVVWVLSAVDPVGLRVRAQQVLTHVESHASIRSVDIAYSLAVTRSHHQYRAAVLASSDRAVRDALRAIADGKTHLNVLVGTVTSGSAPAMTAKAVGDDEYPRPDVALSREFLADKAMVAAARAYVHGVPIDWKTLFARWEVHRIELPTYPFQHRRYWMDPGERELIKLGEVGA